MLLAILYASLVLMLFISYKELLVQMYMYCTDTIRIARKCFLVFCNLFTTSKIFQTKVLSLEEINTAFPAPIKQKLGSCLSLI
jgi:hypothetical protein